MTAQSAAFRRFTAELFDRLPRADQRRWAEVYVQGLLTTAGKKTVRRMAATVTGSATAAPALHQFVNASPWEWRPVQTALARWVQFHTSPNFWTVIPAVFPKRGNQSCGVHRRFIPQTGRTVNCQIGIGANLSSPTGALPVAWNLLLPAEWSSGEQRRRARIPGDGTVESAVGEVLALTDGLTPQLPLLPVVVDLVGYLDTTTVILGLVERGHDFVVAVPDNLLLQPGSHLAARQCAEAAPVRAAQLIDERSGPHPSGLAYLPRTMTLPGLQRTYRLFGRRRPGRPGQLWLTNMPNRPYGELLTLVDSLGASTATLGRLERDFGLRDFEGRSYPGWHHHMTLTSAAYAFDQVTRHHLAGQAQRQRRTA